MVKLWRRYSARHGLALVMSLIFLMVFSVLSLSLYTTSNTNLQAASNHVQSNRARMATESGLEFIKHWMGRIHLAGYINPDYRYVYLRHYLAVDMLNNFISDVIENEYLWIGYQSGGIVINAEGDRFTAALYPIDQSRVQIIVSGTSGELFSETCPQSSLLAFARIPSSITA